MPGYGRSARRPASSATSLLAFPAAAGVPGWLASRALLPTTRHLVAALAIIAAHAVITVVADAITMVVVPGAAATLQGCGAWKTVKSMSGVAHQRQRRRLHRRPRQLLPQQLPNWHSLSTLVAQRVSVHACVLPTATQAHTHNPAVLCCAQTSTRSPLLARLHQLQLLLPQPQRPRQHQHQLQP